MRMEGVFRLIDFDASVSYFDKQYVGAKYSSAYCPPEILESVDTTIFVRTYKTDAFGAPIQSDLPYSLLVAHPSYDMWSLGVTLYQVLELVTHHNRTYLIILIFSLISCTLESHYSLQMTKAI